MRPHTPTLNISHPAPGTIGPTSPPDTPTTSSPVLNRTLASNGQPPPPAKARYQTAHQSSIRPLGGTQFSYNPAPRPEEISPQLSHSSDDEESDTSSSPPPSSVVDVDIEPELQPEILVAAIGIDDADFAIESLSDCSLGVEDENVPVLLPDGYEYPESDTSRSRSRSPPGIDPEVMEGVQNMNPFDDSEGEYDHDDEFVKRLRDNRQKRRQRRMQSGSISKRTVSERGSDSDREDVLREGNDSGSSTRRTRRKVGDRTSIQFAGPLPERIEELKEPLSEDEIILEDAEVFAKELPYWTLMDVDSE
ncbi:hypothetical protein F4775DRAFT_107194 [Biscogniauxia sp. FL1348]|nr:hypothetical protein F4775DRAFT_107194 [Biscogniauxia sp. FL1348]